MQEPQTRLYNQLLKTAFIRGVRKVIEVISGSNYSKTVAYTTVQFLRFTYRHHLIEFIVLESMHQARCSTRTKGQRRTSSKATGFCSPNYSDWRLYKSQKDGFICSSSVNPIQALKKKQKKT